MDFSLFCAPPHTTRLLSFLYVTGILVENLGDLVGDFNDFTGSIPSDLGLLTNMKVFKFNSNSLTGTVPQSLYDNFQDAFIFSLHDNQLSGTLPTTGLWRDKLEMFGVGTQIVGKLPTEIGLAPNLKELLVHSNQLTGTIPSEIGLLSSLKAIALADNIFSGTLPSGIGNNDIGECTLLRID